MLETFFLIDYLQLVGELKTVSHVSIILPGLPALVHATKSV